MSYPIRFDAHLVEGAVLLAEADLHSLQRRRFRHERNHCYESEDPEERDRQFSAFHHRWFDRMQLGRPVERLLGAYPTVRAGTERCLVLPADRAKNEIADLRDETMGPDPVRDDGETRPHVRPSLFLQVRPALVADSGEFERFLAHELLHVADMLDSAFGYDPELPPLEGGPARVNQVRDRYRVLWDCTIDGRLSRTRGVPEGVAGARQGEFAAAFPESGPDVEERFRSWWERPRPSHAEIMAVAIARLPAASSRICPLCRFPYASLYPDVASLPEELLRRIRDEFPSWTVEQGLCLPCADLYTVQVGALVGRGSGR